MVDLLLPEDWGRVLGLRAERVLTSEDNAALEESEVMEFGLEPERLMETELELGIWNGRELDWCGMHFASNAGWSHKPWKGGSPASGHAHAPKDVIELRNWLTSTIRYVAYEVAKFA